MADFCQQCSIELFGEDFGDMANLMTEAESRQELVVSVLCEGCGPTHVDRQGRCIYHGTGTSRQCCEHALQSRSKEKT